MKIILKIATFAILIIVPVSGKTDDLSIIGTAETIGHLIIGETTVSPSYCLNTWDYSGKYVVTGGSDYEKDRLMVRYNQPTGTYIFYARVEYYPFSPTTNTSAFMTPIVLQNFFCHSGSEITTVAQTYTVLITCTEVTTGLAPPSGPFDISFKTVGTAVRSSCTDTHYGWSREFRKTYKVQPYGFVIGRVAIPNFSLAYPFQCWAGPTYLY